MLCREDLLASACGVTAAEVNPIAQAARVRKRVENNISEMRVDFPNEGQGVLEDVKDEVRETQRVVNRTVGVTSLPSCDHHHVQGVPNRANGRIQHRQ